MKGAQVLAAVGGLLTVLGGIGGLSWWSSREAVAADPQQWRPKCLQRMGWDNVDVVAAEHASPVRNTLFGLDLSPSNRELGHTQLDAVIHFAVSLPAHEGTGILLVSDRSDRSSTPDLPLAAALESSRAQVTGLPCWPDCETDSLFGQRCAAQLDDALEQRVSVVQGEIDGHATEHLAEREQQLSAWRAEVEDWQAGKGTSLFRFWQKVADLPQVQRSPSTTRVVLMSDLEEARTRERAKVERFARQFERNGTCPEDGELPQLDGVEIVLVQTVTDRIDAEKWGTRWEAVLGCAGATVVRHRYSPALPFAEYLQ